MLTIANLQFGYGKTPVLNIPKLNLPDGQNLLIQGPSGSGKTSLLFLLAGFLKPTSGTIQLGQTNPATLTSTQKDAFRGQHIGFVFQQPHLMAPLTILQNLQVVQTMNGQKPDTPHSLALLKKLGLQHLAHRYPAQLSQGQQQRAGIARALVNQPQFILADEPTSALDDTACQAVTNLLLQTAAEQGAQVIVTSHDSRLRPHFKHTLTLQGKSA